MSVNRALESSTMLTVLLLRGPSTIVARALACSIGLRKLRLHSLVLRRQENDLGVRALGHGLHSL